MTPIRLLSLGTRFSFAGSSNIWVLLSREHCGKMVQWNGPTGTVCWEDPKKIVPVAYTPEEFRNLEVEVKEGGSIMPDFERSKAPPVIKTFIRPEGHYCHSSTTITDQLSFGKGKLDFNGFWEIGCPECARAWEKQFPDSGTCWPPDDLL